MIKTKVYITILSVLIGLTLAFIWINSCLPPETSGKESSTVYEGVVGAVTTVVGEQKAETFKTVFTEQVLRKLAHFSEFGLLGLELALLHLAIGKLAPKHFVFLGGYGVVVAIIDECIQIFSKRGASVIDVLIDLCGYVLICAVTVAIIFLIKRRKDKKTLNG